MEVFLPHAPAHDLHTVCRVKLTDVVGQRVTVQFTNGRVCRYCIDMRPCNPLALHCFAAMREVNRYYYLELTKEWVRDYCKHGFLVLIHVWVCSICCEDAV